MITLILDIAPTAKGRPKFGKGLTYTPAKTRAYEYELKQLMRSKYGKPPLTGALKAHFTFHLQRPKKIKREHPTVKPDVDNFMKAVMDAGNDILWVDDAQIVQVSVIKKYGEPSVGIAVEELP